MDKYYLNKSKMNKVYVEYHQNNNTYYDTVIIYKQNQNRLLFINIILIIKTTKTY
jgi:hypothetical protein